MSKRILIVSLFLAIFCLPLFAFAADDSPDEISITTYYPSPYGTYNELSTNKFAVGYLTSAEQPVQAGDIRLKPQEGDPATWYSGSGKEGEIAYFASKDTLYVHNGSTWVAQAGVGAVVYAPKCRWGCSLMSASAINCTSTCTPPDCADNYTDLGTGCAAMGGGISSNPAPSTAGEKFAANGYGYCERYCVKQ